jgi:hypothetical protein
MPKTKKKVPNWDTVVTRTKAVTPQSTPKKPNSPQLTYNKWVRGSPMTPKKLNMTPKKTPKKKSLFSRLKKYIVG